MTPLERRARWLLRCFPATYREQRGEEIIGTLLEATPDGRTWPQVRDIRALVSCGLKARAAETRQRTAGANLRVAVMAGLAMYLAYWFAEYVDTAGPWFSLGSLKPAGWISGTAAATALLLGATVVLAWTAPRAAVLVAALGSAAGVASFALAVGGPAALFGGRLLQVLALAGLAWLAPRAGHPSRHWLWLPGVIAGSALLLLLGVVGPGWLAFGLVAPALPLLVIAVIGVVWVGVDARLIVAVLTFLAVVALQMPVIEISAGYVPLDSLPFLLVVLALAAPAVWLLRRQSARPARAAS